MSSANAEQVLVEIELFVPEDWLHQRAKVTLETNGVEETLIEKEIFPNQRHKHQLVLPKGATLLVYYNDDLGYRKELVPGAE